jgi:hypothetical protein
MLPAFPWKNTIVRDAAVKDDGDDDGDGGDDDDSDDDGSDGGDDDDDRTARLGLGGCSSQPRSRVPSSDVTSTSSKGTMPVCLRTLHGWLVVGGRRVSSCVWLLLSLSLL